MLMDDGNEVLISHYQIEILSEVKQFEIDYRIQKRKISVHIRCTCFRSSSQAVVS